MSKASRRSADGLTIKERMFCHSFIIHQNGSRALREAGYKFNPAAGNVYVNTLFKKEPVKKYLAMLSKKIQGDQEAVCDEAKKVLKELGISAFSDPRNYFTVDKNGIVTLNQLDKLGEKARAIAKIKQTVSGSINNRTQTTEISFHSKMDALKLLGEHHKLYTQLVRHSGEVISPIIYKLPDDGSSEPVKED